jgi:hypothetical protein
MSATKTVTNRLSDLPFITIALQSPALHNKATLYPAEWDGKVPFKVKVTRMVKYQRPFGDLRPITAYPGQEYFVKVTNNGAVFLILHNRRLLPVSHTDFQILAWHEKQ